MPRTKKRSAHKISKIVGTTVVLLLVLFIVQAYLLGPKNVLGRGVLNYLPLPAALVNSSFVTLGDYYQRVEVADRLKENASRKVIIDQLVENKITELTAANKKIEVTSADIDQGYSDLQRLTNKKLLGEDYGLSESEFRKQILVPSLEKTALQVWVASNKKLNDSAYKKLDAVKQRLSNKVAFSSVASEYSEDAKSAQIGGDMGFISYSDLVPELFNQLDDIKDKDAHVLISRFGIHVIQVTDRDTKGPQGSTRYHLKQIFLQTTDYTKWFEKQKPLYTVLRFVG